RLLVDSKDDNAQSTGANFVGNRLFASIAEVGKLRVADKAQYVAWKSDIKLDCCECRAHRRTVCDRDYDRSVVRQHNVCWGGKSDFAWSAKARVGLARVLFRGVWSGRFADFAGWLARIAGPTARSRAFTRLRGQL